MATAAPASTLHVVLFPFMAKGHTIPILDFSRLLLSRGANVTLFTTPSNLPFISTSLSDTTTNIISLPFPQNIPGIPSGVESTDKLPSMSLFTTFALSTKLIKPHFQRALQQLPPVTFMVTDGFLDWTQDTADEFNIPRLIYYGLSNFAMACSATVAGNPGLFKAVSDDDELVSVPDLPWIKLAKNDFDRVFTEPDPNDPHAKWVNEVTATNQRSYGVISNSFWELENVYADYWNNNFRPKSWCVGPFCLWSRQINANTNREKVISSKKPPWIVWLDEKRELGIPVLYVAFGSQAEISPEQFNEIEIGLEKSQVNFLWVVRRRNGNDGFEERVKQRGIVVKEWVDQREILEHDSVKGFLSHCGWNSVLESISAKVPILAWPMMADQPLNARFVVEEMKIGLRVERCDGSVKWEGLEKTVRELMEGEKGKEVRKTVKEVGGAALEAVEDGGSSWRSLNELINELQGNKAVTA